MIILSPSSYRWWNWGSKWESCPWSNNCFFDGWDLNVRSCSGLSFCTSFWAGMSLHGLLFQSLSSTGSCLPSLPFALPARLLLNSLFQWSFLLFPFYNTQKFPSHFIISYSFNFLSFSWEGELCADRGWSQLLFTTQWSAQSRCSQYLFSEWTQLTAWV